MESRSLNTRRAITLRFSRTRIQTVEFFRFSSLQNSLHLWLLTLTRNSRFDFKEQKNAFHVGKPLSSILTLLNAPRLGNAAPNFVWPLRNVFRPVDIHTGRDVNPFAVVACAKWPFPSFKSLFFTSAYISGCRHWSGLDADPSRQQDLFPSLPHPARFQSHSDDTHTQSSSDRCSNYWRSILFNWFVVSFNLTIAVHGRISI